MNENLMKLKGEIEISTAIAEDVKIPPSAIC